MAADPGTSKSRDRVIRVTYLLSSIDVSCLFMQFAVTPVSSSDCNVVVFLLLSVVFLLLSVVFLLLSVVFLLLSVVFVIFTCHSKPSVFNFGELVRLLQFPGVMAIFIIKVLSGFPIGVFMLMFPIISVDYFGLNAATAGYLMSYFGILQLVVMTNVFHFCLIAIPMVFTLCVSGVITDSILTKAVPPSETGAMLGICASIQPLTRTIGPTIGGYLYKHYGVPSFGLFNIIINVLLLMYLINTHPKRKTAKNN
ncbi:hypothetical protein GDO81_022736 [Engystomops pustulosus]|uniref:Solute carrier family 22 member 18 n=1 Tax=Engystomops pustulosus TaxID=76066 RepID=A0AAV6ZWJ9_ENGPU|nr:hypothetical protein GDO81_022736 [Engystomops pustulosus]